MITGDETTFVSSFGGTCVEELSRSEVRVVRGANRLGPFFLDRRDRDIVHSLAATMISAASCPARCSGSTPSLASSATPAS
jgi:hypothetical protein